LALKLDFPVVLRKIGGLENGPPQPQSPSNPKFVEDVPIMTGSTSIFAVETVPPFVPQTPCSNRSKIDVVPLFLSLNDPFKGG
jgi:hypothetical protein